MAISAAERQKVSDALACLPKQERTSLLAKAASEAFIQLPTQEYIEVEKDARRLGSRIKGLGPIGALEILAAVGQVLETR